MKHLLLIFTFFIFSMSSKGQVFINELTSDAGNNDGSPTNQTGEFVELYNAGAAPVDISGWILLDDDAAFRFASGTIIPAGGHFLVSSYGLDAGPGGTSGTGISCTTCDFTGITVNANYGLNNPNTQRIGNHTVGSTCSGEGNRDEAWVLLDNTANIVDAVYFGDELNICGNTTQTFSLPAFGTLPAITVSNPIAPHNGTSPTVTSTANITNTNNVTWSYAGPKINGCNSSYQRIPDGAIFANGVINNNTLELVGTYASGAQPTTQPTNHPTPGTGNSSVPFTFGVTGAGTPSVFASTPTGPQQYFVCGATPVTFSYVVNNYQNVQNMTTYASGKIGSYVLATGAGAIPASPWTSITTSTPAAGQTTLTYSVTPPVGSTTYELVWADYIVNCCGSSSYNVTGGSSNTSTAWECYERRKVEIIRVDPMVASKLSISCPTDFTPGTVNLSSLITGGANITYELFANAVSQGTNTTGVFTLSNSLASPITATVTDGSGCNPPITITINDNCKAAPVCPTLVLNTTTSSPSGSYCPGSNLNLCIDVTSSTNLPNGGVISWYKGTTSTFNPFTAPASDLIDTAQIVVSGGGAAPYTGAPRINEVCYRPVTADGTNGASGEWIEIACNPSSSIGCYLITDGDFVVQIPSGTTCPASGFYVIGTTASNAGNPSTPVTVNLATNTCGTCVVGGSSSTTVFNLTNGGEFMALFDGSGTMADIVVWGSPSATNSPGGTETMTASAGCSALTSINHTAPGATNAGPTVGSAGRSIARDVDGSGSWTNDVVSPTAGATNGGAPPSTTTINCKQYTVTADDCNNGGNLYIKAIVQPIDATCSQPNATSAGVGPITVVCPTITISGTATVCNGTGSPTTAILTMSSSGGLNGYVPWISVNGNSAPFPALVGAGPTYQIFTPLVGSYEIDSLVPPSSVSCKASIASPNYAEVLQSNPPMVIIQGGCTGTPATQPTVLVSPQEAVTNPIYSITVPAGATPSTSTDGAFVLPANYTGPITAQLILGTCTTSVSSNIGPCPPIPAVLPVQLVNFSAVLEGENALVEWTSLNESNFGFYDLEKSYDAVSFNKIYTTPGKGQNTLKSDYNFLDENVKAGYNYYRLKMVDMDGKFVYSDVIRVNLNATQNSIHTLYPNPTSDFINVGIDVAKDQRVNIQILDITGKVVSTQSAQLIKGYKTIQVSTSSLAAGKYFVRIGDTKNSNQASFIKQ